MTMFVVLDSIVFHYNFRIYEQLKWVNVILLDKTVVDSLNFRRII